MQIVADGVKISSSGLANSAMHAQSVEEAKYMYISCLCAFHEESKHRHSATLSYVTSRSKIGATNII
jgi:hypothetical protein